jgi:predicted phage-related endonuclease
MKKTSIRQVGVSSSKMDAILNKSKFKTALEQYLLDTKQIKETVSEVGEQKMAMGLVLEPVIKQLVEKAFNVKLTVDKTRYCHDKYERFTIEFDALDYDNRVVYEFKNTEKGEKDLYETYYAQVQFAMYMINWNHARLCYLRNGWELGHIDIPRDDNFIEYMVKVAEYYVSCLENQIEPDLAYIDSITANIDFYNKFKSSLRGVNQSAELSPEEIETLYKWNDVRKKIAELEVEEAIIKEQFSEKFGKFTDGIVSYSHTETVREGGYDIEALFKDHPEIDKRLYKKGDTKFSRQFLRVKQAKKDGLVVKDTEDIV